MPDSTNIIAYQTADLATGEISPVQITCTQYDRQAKLIAVRLKENGKDWTIPTGYRANVRMRKADGVYVYNTCTTEENIAYITLTEQMCGVVGEQIYVLEVINGDHAVQSVTGRLKVIQNPIDDEEADFTSTPEYTTIQTAVADAQQAAQDAADAAQKVVDESMADYLKKSGDTMQGDINMGNYNIGHIARLFGSSSATNYIQFFVQGCGGTVTKIYGTNYSGESQSVEVGNGGVTLNSTGPVNLNSGAGTINANNKRIQNVASPTASGDAATMGYVDDEISRLKESCAAAYVPISAAIRPTVSGNPILVQDSVAWPLQSLVLHGKTTQDGTPSPDNPVPLVSAGDEGQIDVTVCGANLLDISGVNFSGNNWATVQKNSDGSLTITGENPPYDYFVLGGGNISLAKGTYFVNGGGNQIYVQIGVKKGGEMTYRDHSPFTIDGTEENINFSVQCGVGQIYVNNMTIYPMLNVGSTALPFEPYTGKTITISTPNGLPGIPVDSGGNYTDSTRQQWICDEIDVIAAEKIQRIGIIDNYNGESVGDVWMSTTGQLTTGAKVLYQLNEPVTTQIVADTLISYDGTTTAYTTSGADLTMQYVADAQKYIDNKIGAVSAAMLEE